jgi:hypothetical protein
MNKKVNKELSPEEQMILSNISSLLTEIQQGTSNTPSEEPPVMEQEGTPSEELENNPEEDLGEKEVKMILKAIEETSSDGATASDDAEERIDDPLPDASQENVDEVAKTLGRLLLRAQKSRVKKSAPKSASTEILSKLTTIIKNQDNKINELSEALTHVLKGLGMAKQLEIAKEEEGNRRKVGKSAVSQNEELTKALKSIVDTIKGQSSTEGVNKMNNREKVQKSLGNRENLRGLLDPNFSFNK